MDYRVLVIAHKSVGLIPEPCVTGIFVSPEMEYGWRGCKGVDDPIRQ